MQGSKIYQIAVLHQDSFSLHRPWAMSREIQASLPHRVLRSVVIRQVRYDNKRAKADLDPVCSMADTRCAEILCADTGSVRNRVL